MDAKVVVVGKSNIGDYFKKLRENTKLTQTEAAKQSGVSQQLISMLEKSGIRSATRWNGVSKLLNFYAQNGSPSFFALIYQDGVMIEKFPEVYLTQPPIEAKESIKQQLKDLIERIENIDL